MLPLGAARSNQLLKPYIYIQQFRYELDTSLLIDHRKYRYNRFLYTTSNLTVFLFISNTTSTSIPFNYIS